jgi:hypothetical protein
MVLLYENMTKVFDKLFAALNYTLHWINKLEITEFQSNEFLIFLNVQY